MAFARTGDIGDGFAYDTTVAGPSELTALEGEAAGYLVFVTDLQTDFGAYSGRSGVVKLIAGPDWELVALYTGPKGSTGDQGDKGWSPQLVIVSDGARRVFQLGGYVGGAGAAPTANVGEYLKSDGTFTATIGDAVDVRGPAGTNGTGTVTSIVAGDGIDVDDTDPENPVISVTSTDGISSVVQQVFTSSGTYTPTPGMKYCVIRALGAGGGGGGAASAGSFSIWGGGGGAGSWSEIIVDAATIGPSQSVTIGAAGSAGSAGANAGGNGGDTSVGTLCVGKGGTGGPAGSTSTANAGGAGGVAGTGTVTTTGAPGGPSGIGQVATSQWVHTGMGGSSLYGGGGASRPSEASTSRTGGAATGRGAGGGGGATYNGSSAAAGGAGAAGFVVITEYL